METATPTKTKKAKAPIVIGIILCLILIPILIVNVTIIIQSYSKPDKIPGFMGYKPFIVLSGSMEPEFYAGDVVIVKEVSPETLKKADIIAFREGEAVITHRIYDIKEIDGQRLFTTKGDNNNVDDGNAILGNLIEGMYLKKVSGLGNIAMFMQTTAGMIVFIMIPLMIFVVYDVFRRRYYYKREKSQNEKMQDELEQMRKQLEEAQTQKKQD